LKLLLIFFLVVGIAAIVLAVVCGFVYGIVKRGKQRDEAQSVLRNINKKCNLFYEDQSPLATGVRQVLSSYYQDNNS
jgi:hypothetical protein